MTQTMLLSRLSRIALICLITSTLPSTQASSLLLRQAPTCGGNDGLQQCGTGFPSSFCCPKDTTCMSLNSASVQSVICCPAGSDCAFIQPITCDVTQLNATLHPDNQMHLSETDGVELPKCGERCCPLGYSCRSGMCSKDDTASPTSTSGLTNPPTSSPTAPASASQTSSCPEMVPVQSSNGFDGRSFAAGFVPGIVIGALGCLAIIFLIKKRRESQAKERYSGDFGHVARQISDPIYDPQQAARTDFIRRGSHSAQTSPNSTDRIVQGMREVKPAGGGLTPRIKSMWDRTPKLNFGFSSNTTTTTNNNNNNNNSYNPPASSGLPIRPTPPTIRAGTHNDPYTTPRQKRIHSTRRTSSHRSSNTPQYRPQVVRSGSTETIDVLMPAPSFLGNHTSSFLAPPKAPGMKENRYTTDSTNTTFTKLMERAGFDDDGRREVRDFETPRR